MKVLPYIFVAICNALIVISCVAGSIYCVMHDHPKFAVAVLVSAYVCLMNCHMEHNSK